MWNAEFVVRLRDHGLFVFLPQETSEPMMTGEEPFSPHGLFAQNVKEIEKSGVIVAIFDQADPDSGTCWECGYAYSKGIPIIGVRTDFRAGGDDLDMPINLMLAQSCHKVINLPIDKRRDLDWIIGHVVSELEKLHMNKS